MEFVTVEKGRMQVSAGGSSPSEVYSHNIKELPADEKIKVTHIANGHVERFVRRIGHLPGMEAIRLLLDVQVACRLWWHSRDSRSIGLLEADRAALIACALRSLIRTPGRIVLFGFYLIPARARTSIVRRAVRSANVCVVWSREQARRYACALELPQSHFVVVPYKANHSKYVGEQTFDFGNYIFSGGNSERDYGTLFEAVRGLTIPFVVSTTTRESTRGLSIPENVVLVGAEEPHFRRLMAAARIVVVPLTTGRLRGAGEASFLNAMWHGRPVICGDDVSAPEYIDNWSDGVVVPPGDPVTLRKAITTLWQDRRTAEALGRAGCIKVKSLYTHEAFWKRMIEVACWNNTPSPM